MFNVLHTKIAPLIRRHFDYAKDQETRQFKSTPKKFRPDTKLELKDEFLLTLMKLRLGLLGKDIAHRFGISNTLFTQIFHSWIRGMVIFSIICFYARYRNNTSNNTKKLWTFRKFNWNNWLFRDIYRNSKKFRTTECNLVRI